MVTPFPLSKRVCIIGAGPLGLSAAYYLSCHLGSKQLGHSLDIDLLDISPKPGGLACSHRLENGEPIEAYYHHIFKTDLDFIALAKELGVFEHLSFASTSVGHYYNDRLYSLDGPRKVLAAEFLTISSRIRFLIASAYLKTGLRKFFKGESAIYGCNRLYGNQVTERIWKPLLQGKFGEYQNFVPMSWLASRVRDRSIKLGYMHGGFELFYKALNDACIANKVRTFYSSPVNSLTALESKVFVNGIAYDACLSTVGPVVEKKLDIVPHSENIMYLGAICVVYEMDVDPCLPYWTNYCDSSSPVLAVINHRKLDNSSRFGNCYPVYSAAYLMPDSILYRTSDSELINLFFDPIKNIAKGLGISPDFNFNRATVYRSTYAQPLINPDMNLPPIADFEGPLYRVSMHSIYPNDRGQNYAVSLGRRIAEKIALDLGF